MSISTILLLYERVSLATLACLRENQKLHWRNTAADAGGDIVQRKLIFGIKIVILEQLVDLLG